jgi:hypothetical protein
MSFASLFWIDAFFKKIYFLCIWLLKNFILYKWALFYKKKIYFLQYVFYNIFILFYSINMCFYFYCLLLILINKLSRHEQINILFCRIKYFNLHPFINFFNFFYLSLTTFYLHSWLLIYLIRYLYDFFYLHFNFLYVKKFFIKKT